MKKMIFCILFVLSGGSEIDKLAKYRQTLEFEKIRIFNNASEFYSEIELILNEDGLIVDGEIIKMRKEFIQSILIYLSSSTLLIYLIKQTK